MSKRILVLLSTIALVFFLASCDLIFPQQPDDAEDGSNAESFFNHADIISTAMDDETAFVVLSDTSGVFTEDDWNNGEYYMHLDALDDRGRVGVTIGLFDYEHFPKEERGSISSVTPTGWVNNKYDFVSAKYLMNRCHTLGWQFSGIGAEPKALISGTRFFNIEGMLPFENQIADHMESFNGMEEGEVMHQVLVKAVPDFHEANLLCHGLYFYADCRQCDDIDFAVYIFNKQPGVTIDYRDGSNWANTDGTPPVIEEVPYDEATFIINPESMIFHEKACHNAPDEDSENYVLTDMSYDDLVADKWSPCGSCLKDYKDPVGEEVSLEEATYILNSNSKKIHNVGESCAPPETSRNYKLTGLSFNELVEMGYEPCRTCKPTADSAHQPVLPAA